MSYKRNQVIWAIWKSFANSRISGNTAPDWFATRVKRLLDLDRIGGKPCFAFMETLPRGRGADTAFTDFDAFCLALGIELLDAGFKQSEVAFLLKNVRPRLSREYKEIMVHQPIPLRTIASATDYPNVPCYPEGSIEVADFRRFMLVEKVEFKEVFPTPKKPKEPMIMDPVFCNGLLNLMKEIHERGWNLRKVLILELSTPATLVKEYLEQALEAKRGRG